MPWLQRQLRLPEFPRGFHLVTDHVVDSLPELARVQVGLLHVFIQHTSASITINENADSDVPLDLESSFDHLAPSDFRIATRLRGQMTCRHTSKRQCSAVRSACRSPTADFAWGHGRASISASIAIEAAHGNWCSRCKVSGYRRRNQQLLNRRERRLCLTGCGQLRCESAMKPGPQLVDTLWGLA